MGHPSFIERNSPERTALSFYELLRKEVTTDHPALSREEQSSLRAHYRVMMNPSQYPVELAATIYARRRAHPIAAVLGTASPVVLDAGCGYGSESVLFAALGAKVVAVDRSEEQLAVAEKRRRHFEAVLGMPLDLTFVHANLDDYAPAETSITLTWIASVLAAIRDQDSLLRRIQSATRPRGRIILSDMNLWNPLFCLAEFKRRRDAAARCLEFAEHASFPAMYRRRGRIGARYWGMAESGTFDDVQFFTPGSLAALLERVGFTVDSVCYSGLMPPAGPRRFAARLETALSSVPGVRRLGYFYTVSGMKHDT